MDLTWLAVLITSKFNNEVFAQKQVAQKTVRNNEIPFRTKRLTGIIIEKT